MKSKILLLTVLLPFMISCNPPNNSQRRTNRDKTESEKNCINQIIARDNSLGEIRNHSCEKISLSSTIQDYVKSLEELNYTNCPEDFVNSFSKHRESWINMIELTDNYSKLRGEMHDLFNAIEAGKDSVEFKKLLKSIWDTWEEVEVSMK